MKNSDLENLEKEVISKHKELKELNLEKRRKAIIELRDARTKKARKSAVVLFFIGLLSLYVTYNFWYIQFNMSLQSNVGIIAGVILAAFGFKYINSNMVSSYRKLFADDFTDEDITTYFQEEEKVNRQALYQFNKVGKYIVFVCGGIIILLINIESTKEFGLTLLTAGITIFIFGIVILATILRPKV